MGGGGPRARHPVAVQAQDRGAHGAPPGTGRRGGRHDEEPVPEEEPLLLVGPLLRVGEALDDEGWGEVRIHATVLTLLLSLVANVLYFSIDEVATQLEAPFGRDENDVDFEEPLV